MGFGYVVAGLFALFGLLIVGLIVHSRRTEAARQQAWDAFVAHHGLRRGSPHDQPWSRVFPFTVGQGATFSEVLEGEVDGVPFTLCNTSAGLSGGGGSKASVGTAVIVPLEGGEAPECFLIPTAGSRMLGRMLEMLGPALGVRVCKVPQQPELGKLYTVIGPSHADLDAALGRLDLLDLLAQPARSMAFGPGWLVVFPEPRGSQWLRQLGSEEELEALARAAMALRKVVSALS